MVGRRDLRYELFTPGLFYGKILSRSHFFFWSGRNPRDPRDPLSFRLKTGTEFWYWSPFREEKSPQNERVDIMFPKDLRESSGKMETGVRLIGPLSTSRLY